MGSRASTAQDSQTLTMAAAAVLIAAVGAAVIGAMVFGPYVVGVGK